VFSPPLQILMEMQCLYFNSLLPVVVVDFKRIDSLELGLQTPFCGAFSWSFDQDPEDRVIFWPISYYLFLFSVYSHFGFVVREPTHFSFFF